MLNCVDQPTLSESVVIRMHNRRRLLAVGARRVLVLDDDDLWAPDKLRLQLRELHARLWCYTGPIGISSSSK